MILQFQIGEIQSEMLVSNPNLLVLSYTRTMMAFLPFLGPVLISPTFAVRRSLRNDFMRGVSTDKKSRCTHPTAVEVPAQFARKPSLPSPGVSEAP